MRRKLINLFEKCIWKLAGFLGYQVIHFLHIGKTGGSAVKAAIKDSGFVFLRKFLVKGNYLFILHKHDFTLSMVSKKEYVFFCLRDPIERFVSGFNSRKRRLEGSPKVSGHVEEKVGFHNFKRANDLAEALYHEDSQISKAAITAMNHILHVKDSVLYWLESQEQFQCKRANILAVLRQKYLESDFLALQHELGISFNRLPTNPVKAHKAPLDSDVFLSDKAKQNLENWYAKDYAIIYWVENSFIKYQKHVIVEKAN